MGRSRGAVQRGQTVDPGSGRLWFEIIMVGIVSLLVLGAVACVVAGVTLDLIAGNLAIKINVQTVPVHVAPTFTFCPVTGEDDEDFRPNVLYCSFNSKFVLSGKAPADREWGTVDDDGNTVPCNQAMPAPAIWIPHPVDPSCWILTNDTRNLLIPTKQEENNFLIFETSGLGMRVWNDSYTAATVDPRTGQARDSNQTVSQGFFAIFQLGEILLLRETSYQRLGGSVETTFSFHPGGSFPLSQFGFFDPNITMVIFKWESDQVERIEESQAVSSLTLASIFLSIAALFVDGCLVVVVLAWRFNDHRNTLKSAAMHAGSIVDGGPRSAAVSMQ